MPMPPDDLDRLPLPCYVADFAPHRRRYRRLCEAFDDRFTSYAVGYSYKTNYLPDLLADLHRLGARAEVVSRTEFRLARRMGVDGSEIVFNGPAKSREDLRAALRAGALINLDSLREVDLLADLDPIPDGARVGLRINTDRQMAAPGGRRSRFGIAPESVGRAEDRLREVGVEVGGLHAHLSSRSRSLDVFRHVCQRLGDAFDELRRESLAFVDVGGGLGRAPDEIDDLNFPSFSAYAATIDDSIGTWLPDLDQTTVLVEPGVSLVSSTLSLYTPVRAVKEVGERTLAVLDVNFHQVKPVKHDRNLPADVYDGDRRRTEAEDGERDYDLVGSTCMEDDYIAVGQPLPTIEAGDVLHIRNLGAYTIVLDPPFIRTRPPIFLRQGAEYRRLRRAESLDDFMDTYRMPQGVCHDG